MEEPSPARPAASRAAEASAYRGLRRAHESDDDYALRSDGAAAPLAADAPDAADVRNAPDEDDRNRGRNRPAPGNAAAENALHGQPHGQVYFVLHTYVAAGYELDVAALAREPAGRALGSDIRVRKNGIDPRTGDRYVAPGATAWVDCTTTINQTTTSTAGITV